MLKRLLFPRDLWLFVGRELSAMGSIGEDLLASPIGKEPAIRWLLLENEEWEAYCSQLGMMNPNPENESEMEEKPAEPGDYCNLYVKETIRREDISEKFSDRKRMIVEKGYIGFDNVILMNESKTGQLFKEANEESLKRFGKPLIVSIDAARLAILIRELINIYEFRLGKLFKRNEFSEGILENMILLDYLRAHSLRAEDFKLNTIQISKKQELIEEQLRKNIWKALSQEQPWILRDNKGREMAEFNTGELFSMKENGIHVNFGSLGLKTKRDLVGLGHILYNPKLFGAQNVQEVLDSWNWLVKRIRVDEETMQMALEVCSLVMMLLTGVEESMDVYLFSLVVDLRELDLMGIDTRPKIEEFGHLIRRHVAKFEHLEDTRVWKAISITQELRKHLSNFSSECRLARLAKLYGLDVRLGKNPDLIINGRRIEVKRRSSYQKYADLSNSIKDAQSQHPDIIAIEVYSLEKRNVKDFKTDWFGRGNLRKALETALTFKRDAKSVVLLFSREGSEGRIILSSPTRKNTKPTTDFHLCA
jgi:hypothetical protein